VSARYRGPWAGPARRESRKKTESASATGGNASPPRSPCGPGRRLQREVGANHSPQRGRRPDRRALSIDAMREPSHRHRLRRGRASDASVAQSSASVRATPSHSESGAHHQPQSGPSRDARGATNGALLAQQPSHGSSCWAPMETAAQPPGRTVRRRVKGRPSPAQMSERVHEFVSSQPMATEAGDAMALPAPMVPTHTGWPWLSHAGQDGARGPSNPRSTVRAIGVVTARRPEVTAVLRWRQWRGWPRTRRRRRSCGQRPPTRPIRVAGQYRPVGSSRCLSAPAVPVTRGADVVWGGPSWEEPD